MTLSRGKFKVCCKTAATILRSCNLLDNEQPYVNYPADFPSIMRGLNYRERWRRCHDEGWYDLTLFDGSILQFRHEADHLSYSFIQCPYQYVGFEEFAYGRLGEVWEEFIGELQEEYEMYRSSEVSEHSVTPIRYDYEPKLYREGYHPAGHFHFGVDNQIRIGTRKIFNPLSFVLFVIRQHFPLAWERVLVRDDVDVLTREVRENLTDVAEIYLNPHDFREHYLV